MKQLSFSIILPLMLSCFLSSCTGNSGKDDYMIVGYVAGYRDFDFSKINASRLTHINYAFANVIDGRVAFGNDKIDNTERNSEDIRKLISLKEDNPDLKVLVSVGGWGWSGKFSDAALTDSSRNRFAESAVDFLVENDLDGIDIDWEYPNQPGAGNVFRAEDIHNFTLLLACLRERFDSLSAEQMREENYLLTIATGGDSTYIANTELGEAAEYLDFINIMSYDLHNGLTWQTGHHSNLYLSDFDSRYGDATERSVKMHLEAGVPAYKLNIGVPFYGRKWLGVEPSNHGLYRIGSTTGMSVSYKEVLEAASDSNFIRYFDSTAAAPFLWNENDSIFISYDDVVSLKEKMKYVRSARLGGVMFWEYSEDTDGNLLNAVYEGLKEE